ncbi:MAG: hypothetical protein KIT14_08010 [bacterium]|nr:hypothetical protein [bacterium]
MPPALARLDAAARTPLLRVARRRPRGAGAAAALLPPSARSRSRCRTPCAATRWRICPRRGRVPGRGAGLLRVLARVHEEAPPARVAAWVERGLALAAEHAAAGVAFFALESRTSLHVLRARATAATFDELQGLLRRVLLMLTGEPAAPHAAGRFLLRPPLEDAPASRMVALPDQLDRLDTWEDNARLYRVVGALLAGRRDGGTYADPALLARVRGPELPAMLEQLFLLADGYRVARRMAAQYPGVADDLAWAAHALDELVPTPAWALDALFALALHPAPDAATPPAWLAATAALVLPSLAPLAASDATVADAVRVAEQLLPLFPEEPAAGLDALPDLITVFLDAEPGEMPLESEPGPPGLPGAAGEAPDPEALPEELRERLRMLVDEHLEGDAGATRPMSAEELRRLLESGLHIQLSEAPGEVVAQAGLYVTQLLGKQLAARPLARTAPAGADAARAPRRLHAPSGDAAVFRYDEWDWQIDDYRPAWCTLREIELAGDGGVWFDGALARHAALVPEIRRHFQRVRPESYRPIRGLEDGEEIDLNAAVDARVQRRARQPGSAKLYTTRRRQERDVATLFLLDMSASTDESAAGAEERIIDVIKDALVIMAAALEEIGDAYAIYGFSGQGRQQVEVYPVKHFGERLGPGVQSRLGGIAPRGSTRMGTALRHALTKLRGVAAPARHLVMLSDGFPQDLDYGTDRQSHVYGIRDTAMALREVQAAGVRPFCLTVDLAGHDYLRQMCDPQQYLIIENVAGLPRELPKIYQRLVRAA